MKDIRDLKQLENNLNDLKAVLFVNGHTYLCKRVLDCVKNLDSYYNFADLKADVGCAALVGIGILVDTTLDSLRISASVPDDIDCEEERFEARKEYRRMIRVFATFL